jgi:hypothetical protein
MTIQGRHWTRSGDRGFPCALHASDSAIHLRIVLGDRRVKKKPGHTATVTVQEIHHSGQQLRPVHDLTEYVREYAREKPEVVALWCLGIGFVLGWKLKPW